MTIIKTASFACFLLSLAQPAYCSDSDRGLYNPRIVMNANGTDRGGGDVYVSEFQDLKRTVIASVDSWVNRGVLSLTPVQLQTFHEFSNTVKIFSLDHVYLDLADPKTEVDFVNEPKQTPPRITIGRIRWDTLKTHPHIDIELMVLHELLSACGIHDSAFEESYKLKVNSLEQWHTFTTELLSRLKNLSFKLSITYSSDSMNSFEAFIATAKMDSDYLRCIDESTKGKGAQKNRLLACSAMLEKLKRINETVLEKFVIDPVKIHSANLQDVYNETGVWLNEQPNAPSKSVITLMYANIGAVIRGSLAAEFNLSPIPLAIVHHPSKFEIDSENACKDKRDVSKYVKCSFEYLEKEFPVSLKNSLAEVTLSGQKYLDWVSDALKIWVDPDSAPKLQDPKLNNYAE